MMNLKMAWRNIWRNPRRSWLTISAVAFACLLLVFMLSFQLGSYDAMINTSVKTHTGHLQIQAEGYQQNQDIRKVVADPQAVEDRVAETEEHLQARDEVHRLLDPALLDELPDDALGSEEVQRRLDELRKKQQEG